MKAFASICLFLFVALASCAAVAFDEKKFNLDAREVEESHAKYIPSTLPDGRKTIAVYNGDVLEGSIVEEPNNEISIWDAYGHQINPADLPDDDDDDDDNEKRSDLERRASKWQILNKFAKFIRKYGPKAWNFLRCLNYEVAIKCADRILGCSMHGSWPWQCLDNIVCGGIGFKRCAR